MGLLATTLTELWYTHFPVQCVTALSSLTGTELWKMSHKLRKFKFMPITVRALRGLCSWWEHYYCFLFQLVHGLYDIVLRVIIVCCCLCLVLKASVFCLFNSSSSFLCLDICTPHLFASNPDVFLLLASHYDLCFWCDRGEVAVSVAGARSAVGQGRGEVC